MVLAGATEAELSFLKAARVARLATVGGQGRPHVVPVCFVLHDERIYSPLDEKPKRVPDAELRRVQDIEDNPFVCLLVDRWSEDWDELAWLQIRAHCNLLLPSQPGHSHAVAGLRERYSQYGRMAIDQRPLLELTPERIVSWRVNR